MAKEKTNKSRAAKAGGKRTAANSKAKKPFRRELGALICGVLLVVSILSFFVVDGWLTQNFALFTKGLIGAGYYVLPASLLIAGLVLAFHDGRPVRLRVFCAFMLSITIGALVHLFADSAVSSFFDLYPTGQIGASGGLIAGALGIGLEAVISKVGAVIVLIILTILELLTSLNMTVIGIFRAIKQRPRLEYEEPKAEHPDPAKVIVDRVSQHHIDRVERKRSAAEFDLPIDDPVSAPKPVKAESQPIQSPDQYILGQRKTAKKQEKTEPAVSAEPVAAPAVPPVAPAPAAAVEPEAPDKLDVSASIHDMVQEETKKLTKEEVLEETEQVAQEIQNNEESELPKYVFPSVDLLNSSDGHSIDGTEEMRQNTTRLNDTLNSFGIDAHIINVVRGPSVTRYELELDRGVKLSKITNLADDIALSLGATGVRISAIPDKISVVGIEVPNKLVSTVLVRDVIDSEAFEKSKSTISFAVGKDIGGNCIVGNIAKLPHMLIAGTTGSGKSVCMNTLIVSLLYKATPEQVRLIMVDPKMVELGIYNGIPHLLIPVVTDPKKAAGSLQWAVCEMMRRYRMMADAGVRDLESYNQFAAHNPDYETMPQIVVVIDELADLMLVAAKDVEESICRIAQMGRASGIHLVIATQRPSADVITGLMKANIPSRIAFAVASAMESRIILDTPGAEKLVGKGDMLFAPLGQGKPKRVQGCFITDGEVQRVVDFVCKDATANYDHSVLEEIDKNAEMSGKGSKAAAAASADAVESSDDCDELLPQAVEVVLETGQASVSMLQRRLKLGYGRAARIVDEMEERGIVGAYSGSKPRELLITKEQWYEMQNGGSSNPPVEEEIP